MIAESKKIIYFGLDALICCLRFIKQCDFEVAKIFTFPDDDYDKTEAISAFAKENNISVSYSKPTADELQELCDEGVSLMIVGGYPWKIPVIESMYQINIHPSLLPNGRGPWPMPTAILRGIDSGVTLHKLTDKIDEGDIILQETIPFDPDDNLLTLTEKIGAVACRLLDVFLSNADELWENAKPQTEGEYWSEPEDSERTFALTERVETIEKILRAFYGYGALTKIYGVPVKIIEGEVSDHPSAEYLSIKIGEKYLICKRWDYAFSPIRLSDRDTLERIRGKHEPLLSDYTFSLLYCWQKKLGLSLYIENDLYVIRAENEFFFPVGEEKKVIAFIRGLLKLEENVKFRFCDENMKRLVALNFGEDASFQMAEGDCDYLICNRAMKDIEGKNLSKRRNQYRAFLKKNNDIKVEYIDQNNIDRVNLLSQNDLGEYIEAERIGIQEYFALGLFGIIVSSFGEDIGFSICSQKDADTMQGHFMKNLCRDRGATFYLMKTCIDYFSDKYTFTNMEDDMGIEGLRSFKMSLDSEIIASYTIEIRRRRNLT
jgi:methionyl-tRNA formyltransferase